jgi:hypothetical protein
MMARRIAAFRLGPSARHAGAGQRHIVNVSSTARFVWPGATGTPPPAGGRGFTALRAGLDGTGIGVTCSSRAVASSYWDNNPAAASGCPDARLIPLLSPDDAAPAIVRHRRQPRWYRPA